ncbi:retrovirus-related pol polyprotein from transposon TNT 1-94 [Tanacetum coccineum]
MMKGSDIGIQDKKAKLFNEWERFTSTYGELIESYYHHFSKLMNDFKRNKHFPKTIASNLKFLNNLQPEWRRHVTIVHQTKDLHEVDYTQLYDFLKYNQAEVNELRAERLARAHDPLALMANSNNPYNYPVFHQDQPSPVTYMQQPQPNNNFIPQPSFNTNYMQQPMPNPEDIIDPTTAMNMALVLMAKAFQPNYSTPTNNNQIISSNPHNRQIAQPVQNVKNLVVQNAVQNPGVQNVGNQNGHIVVSGIANPNANQIGNGNVVVTRDEGSENGNNCNQIRCYNCRGLGHLSRNCTVRPRKKDATYLQTQLLIAQKEEAGIYSKGSLNMFMFLGTVRFGNDHIAAILGYGDLQWGNILITKVYFVEGFGYNLLSVGQFCDSDLEVAFRRNTCFVRNLEGVDLLKEIVQQTFTPSISMKWPLHLQFASWLVLLLPSLGYGINIYPISISKP